MGCAGSSAGQGSCQEQPLALSSPSQHGFVLGTAATFWSNPLRTPEKKQLASLLARKPFVFSVCRNKTFSWVNFYLGFGRVVTTTDSQLLKIWMAILGQIFPFAPKSLCEHEKPMDICIEFQVWQTGVFSQQKKFCKSFIPDLLCAMMGPQKQNPQRENLSCLS